MNDDGLYRKMKLERIERRWQGCRKCSLCESRSRVVFWRGNEYGKLAVVGEAPGATEDETGRPFEGEAGALFDEVSAGVTGPEPWDMFVCNVVGCRPPKNRKPAAEEWEACKVRLYSMLAVVRPKAVLLLGGSALSALTPHRKVTEWRGRHIKVKVPWKSGELVFPAVATLHPGFLLRIRDNKVRRLIAHDIRQAWELAQGGGWVEGD